LDLYFFTVPTLAKQIDEMMQHFCQEHGI
jgi:hypothetical protein